MNEKEYITLEIAKLLKAKGFNEPCEYCIHIKTGAICDCDYDHVRVSNSALGKDWLSCPSLLEVQEWLREEYDCYIQVEYEACKTRVNCLVQVLFYEPNDDDCWSNKSTGKYGDNAEFDSFEDALSFGISEALKRI